MKKMIFAALLTVSSIAMADGAGTGAEEVIAAGGLTTIVGGCANAQLIQNGENTEIVYTGPCQTAPTVTHGSDFVTVFPSQQLAAAHCHPAQGYVQTVYNWRLQLQGFRCAPMNNQNGGN